MFPVVQCCSHLTRVQLSDPSKTIIKEKVTSSTEFERSKFGLSSHKQRCETVEKKLKISYISFAKRNIPLERQRNSSRTAGISSEAILFFFSLYPNEVAVQSDQALPLQSVCLFSLVQNCEIYFFINFYDLSHPIERCNILGQYIFLILLERWLFVKNYRWYHLEREAGKESVVSHVSNVWETKRVQRTGRPFHKWRDCDRKKKESNRLWKLKP